MKKIMASLDVGNDTIKLVVGEMVKKKLNILAIAEAPSKGMKKGLIVDQEAIKEPLKNVFERCEEVLGLKINQVIVTVPEVDADFAISEGTIKVSGENNNVDGVDVIKALQASVKNQVSDNMELISIIPTNFKLDDDRVVKDPKNLVANTLSVKSVIVTAPKRIVYPILTCLEELNIDVLDLSFGSIGDYYEFNNNDLDSEVGIVVNLGDATSTVSVFNKGVLTNTEVIELGGQNIDNDISFIYKLTKVDSKRLKEKLSLAHKRMAQASISETVTNKLGEEVQINQYDISQIVMSRIEEILNLTKKQINLLTKKEISYIIFTGGLTESKDFPLILEEVYGKNVTLGRVNELGVRNNKYSSCAGMIKYYASKAKLKDKDFSIFSIEEQEELSGLHKRLNIADSTVLGKLFGYFFDN